MSWPEYTLNWIPKIQKYGLPETHKASVQFRLILSMTGLSYHELSKCLSKPFATNIETFSDTLHAPFISFADVIYNLKTSKDIFMELRNS